MLSFSTEEVSVCSLDIPEGVPGIEAPRTPQKDGVCLCSHPATSAPKADNVKCLAINNKKKEQKQKILKLNLSVLLTLRPWVNVPPFFSLDPLDLCP